MNQSEPLCRQFNVAVMAITNRLFPTGFDTGPDAPSTLGELVDRVARTGRMLVWDGASEETIFVSPEINHAFRAWHDWCHLRYYFPFDLAGEQGVARVMKEHLTSIYPGHPLLAKWCAIVEAGVVGHTLHHGRTGAFPTDQRTFTESLVLAGGYHCSSG